MGVFACSVLNLGKRAAVSTYTPTGKLLFVCLIWTWGLMNAKPCGLTKDRWLRGPYSSGNYISWALAVWTSLFLGDGSVCSWSELEKECVREVPQTLLDFREDHSQILA